MTTGPPRCLRQRATTSSIDTARQAAAATCPTSPAAPCTLTAVAPEHAGRACQSCVAAAVAQAVRAATSCAAACCTGARDRRAEGKLRLALHTV
eukprot:355645-Chlamydomonas_euryale.AAC.28